MRKTLTLALLSLIMVACSQEEPIITPDKMYEGKQSEHRVSLDDALKTADALLSQIGKPGTRSKSRRVANVKYLTSVATRSGAIDTTLYLVNYENNEGFALLGADDRVRPVYAISDEGQLNMSDTIDNKGLAMFFQNTKADITGLIGPVVPIDTNIYIPQPPVNLYDYEVYRQTEPLLSLNARNIDQRSPYNMYCPMSEDGVNRYAVGCVAVATAQIMMYNEWPKFIGGTLYPWDEVNSSVSINVERIAYLLALLGEEQYLSMDYGYPTENLSSTSYTLTRTTLMSLGYKDPGSSKSFDEEAIIEFFEKAEAGESGGGPIYVRGAYTGGGSGHAWVLDGYLQYNKITNNAIYELQDILFHCVWGWGGDSNGYFYWNPTESFGGEPDIRDYEHYEGEYITEPYNNIRYYEPFVPDVE